MISIKQYYKTFFLKLKRNFHCCNGDGENSYFNFSSISSFSEIRKVSFYNSQLRFEPKNVGPNFCSDKYLVSKIIELMQIKFKSLFKQAF